MTLLLTLNRPISAYRGIPCEGFKFLSSDLDHKANCK